MKIKHVIIMVNKLQHLIQHHVKHGYQNVKLILILQHVKHQNNVHQVFILLMLIVNHIKINVHM